MSSLKNTKLWFCSAVGLVTMDDHELDDEQIHSEIHSKAPDDKKRRWNSFRRGKNQIKKLWKSKKTKQADEEQSSHSGDSHENVTFDNTNHDHPVSSVGSTTSSMDPVPYIKLQRPSIPTETNNSSPEYLAGTTDEDDEIFSSIKKDQKPAGPKSPSRGQLSLASALLNRQESNVCMIIMLIVCLWLVDNCYCI